MKFVKTLSLPKICLFCYHILVTIGISVLSVTEVVFQHSTSINKAFILFFTILILILGSNFLRHGVNAYIL